MSMTYTYEFFPTITWQAWFEQSFKMTETERVVLWPVSIWKKVEGWMDEQMDAGRLGIA